MSKKILFSIILPVYNVEEYLCTCLDSIRYQTYNNIQLIAINDGSTDNSLSILEQYKKKYIPDMVIVNQDNMGLSAARNAGVRFIKGEYTYFLDSDDYIDFSMFEKLNEFILNNEYIDLIKFNATSFLDEKNTLNVTFDSNEFNRNNIYLDKEILDKKNFLKKEMEAFLAPVWLYCVKTDILLENNLNFMVGLIHEDELFTPILYLKCNTFTFFSEDFFFRRYRPNSIMTSSNRYEKSIKNYVDIVTELEKHRNKINDRTELRFIESRINNLNYNIASLSIKYKKDYLSEAFSKLSFKNKIKIKIKEIIHVFSKFKNEI